MTDNILILCSDQPYQAVAADVAKRFGEDLGLVQTFIEMKDEKVSGGRVEEQRDLGGTIFETFDEPIFVGAAVAQLAGHCDVVVLDHLMSWARRLLERFPDNEVELDAEISSVRSVLAAHMTGLVLVAGAHEGTQAEKALHQRLIDEFSNTCDSVIDASGGCTELVRGEMPESD